MGQQAAARATEQPLSRATTTPASYQSSQETERRRESILVVISLRQHVVVGREVSDELERRFSVPLSETNQEWLSRKGEIVEREMLDFINIAVHSQQ